MYWIPKMHKNPIKSRFIVAAKVCSLKPLAKSITYILKRFYKQIETYNAKSRYYSGGVNTFWVVQNKDPIIQTIKKLNSRNKAKSISTFDFSTMYTKIPHNKLKSVMDEIVNFCFRGCDGCCHWDCVDGDTSYKFPSYSQEQVISAINYLVDNSFFKVGEEGCI